MKKIKDWFIRHCHDRIWCAGGITALFLLYMDIFQNATLQSFFKFLFLEIGKPFITFLFFVAGQQLITNIVNNPAFISALIVWISGYLLVKKKKKDDEDK